MQQAVEKAKKALESCCASDQPPTGWGPPPSSMMDWVVFKYNPTLKKLCGQMTVGGFLTGVVEIGPDAFNKGKCCKLESTLVHEANHLIPLSGSESQSRAVEMKCFGCPEH